MVWRAHHEKKRSFFPWEKTDQIIGEIEKFCEGSDCIFLIRMHPWFYVYRSEKAKKLDENVERKKSLFVLSPKMYVNVQDILYITDILITDWSSIANDFIILDRPIIFLDVDFPVKEFKLRPEDRVGYIVQSKRQFFEKLKEAIDCPNLFGKKRKALIKKLYKHLNGNSSRRCAAEIVKLLKEN
jgi:CDP-glycerol glycerophosphotransferase (TagB/SpsB family)